MLEFDRILVPVDFSRDSMAAAEYAIALAKKIQGSQTVTVLYVVDEGLPIAVESRATGSQGKAESEKQLKKHAMAQLEKFIEPIDPGEENLEAAVVVGRPASEQICRFAAERGYDLIVIGHQGRGKLRKLVLGSTTQQVQRYAPCPVLSVKDPAALTDAE